MAELKLAQDILVGAIVLLAAVSAAWRLLSVSARLRCLTLALRCSPAQGGLHKVLTRLANSQRAALVASGCGSCASHKHN